MGAKSLRKIQMGRESGAGTAVAATTIWRGIGSWENQLVMNFPEENVGILVDTDRNNVSALGALVTMDATPLTFEQAPHLFEAGLKSVGTGTNDGVGSGKIYEYPLPLTAIPTIKTYTLEVGDNDGVEEIEYAFVRKITIEGTGSENLNISAEWYGRQLSGASFTGSISLPAVEDIPFSMGKLYLDAAGASFGGTLVSNLLRGLSMEITTGWVARFTASGSLTFGTIRMTKPVVTAELTFEHTGSALTEKANWANKVARLLRLEWEGSALATPGTLYSKKLFRADLAGKWSKFNAIEDEDGNNTIVGVFKGGYNATAGTMGGFTFVNELTNLP